MDSCDLADDRRWCLKDTAGLYSRTDGLVRAWLGEGSRVQGGRPGWPSVTVVRRHSTAMSTMTRMGRLGKRTRRLPIPVGGSARLCLATGAASADPYRSVTSVPRDQACSWMPA